MLSVSRMQTTLNFLILWTELVMERLMLDTVCCMSDRGLGSRASRMGLDVLVLPVSRQHDDKGDSGCSLIEGVSAVMLMGIEL